MMLKKKSIMSLVLLTVFAFPFVCGFVPAFAAEKEVKIGVIYPMTGPIATVGKHAKDAVQLAVDIVNDKYSGLSFKLAPTTGLPNLGGAKIKLEVGNSQGQPEFGRAEAERLITLKGVSALFGCYQSSVTKTASQVAERYRTPFVTGISTAPDLTERGFKYFFRTTLTDAIFADNFMTFLEDLNKKKNAKIKNIGMFYENTEFGVSTFEAIKKSAAKHNFKIVSNIKFPFGSAELDSEIAILKKDKPDFVFCSIMISDLILFVNTSKKLGYDTAGMAGFGGGFMEPELVKTLGADANYFMTRDVFSLDLVNKIPLLAKVNKLYKDKYGVDFDGNSVRAFVGMMVLADAINRAGSTKKEAIRDALIKTNYPADQLIVAWDGVKFDKKGQNVLGKGIIRQIINGQLKTVWPFNIAATDIIFPMPKWKDR